MVTIPHSTDIYVTVDTVDGLAEGDCFEIRLVDPFPSHVQAEGVVHEETICENHFEADGVHGWKTHGTSAGVLPDLDGNPDTRVTGHPSPVTLVTGHFYLFIFIFILAGFFLEKK